MFLFYNNTFLSKINSFLKIFYSNYQGIIFYNEKTIEFRLNLGTFTKFQDQFQLSCTVSCILLCSLGPIVCVTISDKGILLLIKLLKNLI